MMSVVSALDSAAEGARRLGFEVTDRSVHTGRGTANRLIVLPNCYWELLAVEESTPANEMLRAAPSNPGLLGCALSSRDVAADRFSSQANGIPVDAPVQFSRPVEIDKMQKLASFETAFIRPQEKFDGLFFFCRHLTPELIWRETWMDHKNGVDGILGVDVVSTDVRTAVVFLSRLFRAYAAAEVEGSVCIDLGALDIQVMTEATYASYYPVNPTAGSIGALGAFAGLRLKVRSLERLARQLSEQGVSARYSNGGLFVKEDSMGNTIIHFAEK